ncbi:mediator of RNA polymerase II transcription subunit 22 isoform X1 [Dipodomys merriami]|uniref:mediator of RNA polymerase II transcription subunit 22 isoform X1 n=1 Tax=Dipodomys merriami TaxID=94247 RepID=UPI00384B00FB
MAQQRALPQSKETLLQSYNKRLKDDIKSIMDNFTEIIKTAKIEDETQVSRATQGEQDNYEMHVRAANIVRAGESLMKLVSDLKQFLILNDFPSVNEAIDQRSQQLRALQEECDRKLVALRDEVSIDLYELEEEYYSSSKADADSWAPEQSPWPEHLMDRQFTATIRPEPFPTCRGMEIIGRLVWRRLSLENGVPQDRGALLWAELSGP